MSYDFTGCKLAYLVDGQLLVYRRDNLPDIAFPNMWDFPGGGREGDESPEECVLRELQEEFGITISASQLLCKWKVTNHLHTGLAYFFVASGSQAELDAIVFGDEGQYWQLMGIDEFLGMPDAMPILKVRLLRFFQ